MEKHQQTKIISHVVIITIIISLAIASFTLCIICELKKSKKKELRVDGELCFLPRSQAFGYGIANLICSSVGQIVGTGFFVFCKRSTDFKPARTLFASILLLLSWMSFFIMVILTGTTTSMNRRQSYGE
nr:glutamate receptor 3.1 like [Tanacetum cinerariifolium]